MKIHPLNYYELPCDDEALKKGFKYYRNGSKQFKEFIKQLTIGSTDYSGVAGRKLSLIQWQECLLNTMFNWRDKDGRYRFREVRVYAPRRVGKTLLCSTLATYFATKDTRTDILLLAGSNDQAKIAFKRIEDFVLNNDVLNEFFWTREHIKTIQGNNNSLIKILSTGNKLAKGGRSPSFILLDETGEWHANNHRLIFDKLYESTADKADGGILFSITSPQYDLNTLAYEQYIQCKRILNGEERRTDILPCVFEAPANWQDDLPNALKIANPSLNVTVPESYYLEQYDNIKDKPNELIRFSNQCLGLWTGSPTNWIPNATIDRCIDNSINENQFINQPCVLAIDYGASFDLTAMCLIFKKNEKYYVFPRYMIPREIAQQRQNKDNVPYLQWANDKKTNLFLTDGDVVDTNFMLTQLKQDVTKYKLQQIRYDKTRLEMYRQMILKDLPYTDVVAVSTSVPTMSVAFKFLERLLTEGKIVMQDNPISRWCFSNCVPKTDNHDNLKIEKSGSYNKIDFIDSLAIGLTYFIDDNKSVNAPVGNSWAMVI